MRSAANRYLAKDYAKKIAATDVEAFAWLLGLEYTHDSEAEDAKKLIVDALRAYGRWPMAWLREVDGGTQNACWVICAKDDPRSVPVGPVQK